MWNKNAQLNKDNKGATTVIVVCVMAIVMVLSLGLLLSCSVLMKTAGRGLAAEQCRVMAVSLSKQLEEELTNDDFNQGGSELEATASSDQVSVRTYVKKHISDGSWSYYSDAEGGVHSADTAIRTFTMRRLGTTGEIANIEISIYWVCGEKKTMPQNLVVRTKVSVKEETAVITDIYDVQSDGSVYGSWDIEHVVRK